MIPFTPYLALVVAPTGLAAEPKLAACIKMALADWVAVAEPGWYMPDPNPSIVISLEITPI
ncbi:MAG: hypothetical protein LBV31_03150 [Prevotellaceae bacterium]|nr:hypothetical protein [Prevotellaceae bacterium]